ARAVELAVINLLDNAFKYAKDGGVVDVRVARSGSRAVEIRVLDKGPGIDAEDKAKIFDRFVRGRSAQHAGVRGSGIGLALVKHIAESHGGATRVESPVDRGRGSCFVVTLPALRDESPAPAPVAVPVKG